MDEYVTFFGGYTEKNQILPMLSMVLKLEDFD